MKVLRPAILGLTICIACCGSALAGLTRHDVLVIANSNSATSQAVASYYAQKRNIPASHVRLITCTTSDPIVPSDYASIRDQIKAILLSLGSNPTDPAHDPIKTIVLAGDIPHRVNDSAERYSALDTAIAAMFTNSPWGREPLGLYGVYQGSPSAPNPYYGDYDSGTDFRDFTASSASTTLEAFPSPGFTVVRLLDANTALAAGGGGVLFRGVRSAGQWTWTPISDQNKGWIVWRVSAISVLDSTHVYACTGNVSKPHGGGSVIASSDGGQTWTRTRYSAAGGTINLKDALTSIDFADTVHGWAVGTAQMATQSATALMIQTTNSGSSWQDVSSKLPSSFFPRSITAADANNLWICGASGGIYHSADGGSTWVLANTGAPSVTYNCIWIKPSSGAYKGWAVGNTGTVVRTEDGTNWTVQASGLTSSNITDLSVFDAGHACASYSSSSFLSYTTSGGWVVNSTATAPIVSAASAGALAGVAVGGTRYIFADASSTWTCSYTGQDTAWRLRYLVTRLDGYADATPTGQVPAAIKGIIDRGAVANSPGKFEMDEAMDFPGSYTDADTALLSVVGASGVIYDNTSTYLTHQNNVIGYASWGRHDSSADSVTAWGRPLNNWMPGAIAAEFESYDGWIFNQPGFAYTYLGGTVYANKLTVTGLPTTTPYANYKLVLFDSNNNQLASALFSGGQAQINLSSVSWPANHVSYAQIFFPSNDPVHPGGALYNTYCPYNGGNTDIYTNRAAGMSYALGINRTLMSETLAEGASGGVANVSEPWSNYTGQVLYLFPRYAQGYTWGEAAYMGVPGIGWQEVVLGDPMMAPFATPPTVSITTPSSDGQIASGTVHLSTTAVPVNSSGVSMVQLWLDDNALLATLTAAPYQFDLDTVGRNLTDGVHTVEAIAFENDSVQNTGSAFRKLVVNNSGVYRTKISDLVALTDGTAVGISGKVVSGAFNGTFYVEESDRTRGIRVRSTVGVTEGSSVVILGTLATVQGEREIVAQSVTTL